MNTTLTPVHLRRSADARDPDVVTVTLPAADARLTLADRASLRLALWLLLRAERRKHAPGRSTSTARRAATSAAVDRHTALEHTRHGYLRQLR